MVTADPNEMVRRAYKAVLDRHGVRLSPRVIRTVIRAMREPTAEMCAVAAVPEDARGLWQSMLDTALRNVSVSVP